MGLIVDGAQGGMDAGDQGDSQVGLGLADVGAMAVNALEACVGVDDDSVWCVSDDVACSIRCSQYLAHWSVDELDCPFLTVFLMTLPDIGMEVAFVCMPDRVPAGQFGQERAGMLGIRMEEESVNAEDQLLVVSQFC